MSGLSVVVKMTAGNLSCFSKSTSSSQSLAVPRKPVVALCRTFGLSPALTKRMVYFSGLWWCAVTASATALST